MYSEKDTQQDCEDLKDNSMGNEDDLVYSSKGKKPMWKSKDDEEAFDYEQHTKKDCPPRFSTLFESKAVPVPAPVIHHHEETRPRQRGGVFLSWPTVILLGLLLFFETVALSAYTAIGLYNNMPQHLLTPSHSTTAALDVAGSAGQAPVNIAPNFVIGAADRVTVTETTTIFLPTHLDTAATETAMAALESDVRGLLHPSSTSISTTVPVVTVTPGGGTATSVVLVTHSADSTSSIDRPTSFVTQFVAPSVLLAQQAASLASKAADNARAQASSSITSSTPPPTTAATTSTSSSSSSSTTAADSTTSTPPAAGTGKLCLGGAGAVFQNCI